MLNANKKKRLANVQAAEDRKTKWCDKPALTGGSHGYYACKRCPVCEIDRDRKFG